MLIYRDFLGKKVHNLVSPQENSNSRKIKVLREFFGSFPKKRKTEKFALICFLEEKWLTLKNHERNSY